MKALHKVGFAVAAILTVWSWLAAIYYWDKLPLIIPTHFNVSGMADAWNNKSVWYVFLLPGMQLIFLIGFAFLYYKPQYSDMPTTLWLMTMEPRKRDHAFDLIRTMIVGVLIWIGVLFTYLGHMMNVSALNPKVGPNPWIMFGIIMAMIVWLGWWTVKVYRATKDAIKKEA